MLCRLPRQRTNEKTLGHRSLVFCQPSCISAKRQLPNPNCFKNKTFISLLSLLAGRQSNFHSTSPPPSPGHRHMANQSSRPLSIANLEDALRISPPVAQPSPVNSRPASLFGGSTPPARPGNGLGSMPLGGAGLGGSVHHPRPVSEAFATYEAEQLDRYV